MLYLIGLGLKNERSLSIESVDVLKSCDEIFLEGYTSRQVDFNINNLELLLGKKVRLVGRSFVESTDNLLNLAKDLKVALLVVGDPMIATTHLELVSDARKKNISYKIFNNVSIINVVANLGLEAYKFGKITSIPFTTESFMPETPYDVIKDNKSIKAHTLCLLDLQLDKDRFMTFNEALLYLLKIEDKRKEGVLSQETLVVGCAALGSDNEKIAFGRVKDVLNRKFDIFPQCLIILSNLHFMEKEALITLNSSHSNP